VAQMFCHQFAEARSHVLVQLRDVEAILIADLPEDPYLGHMLVIAEPRFDRNITRRTPSMSQPSAPDLCRL